MMGLPIRKLILATNENDVLDEFFRTGLYRPRSTAETRQTSSPSMDISKASNFERFIFDLTGRDAERVKELWKSVDQEDHSISPVPIYGQKSEILALHQGPAATLNASIPFARYTANSTS